MARELFIFKSVLPNYDNNTHYYFTDALAYFDYLTQNYEYVNCPLDNSRDNTNVIKISANALNFDYNEATYVIDCEIRPSIAGAPKKLLYWKCFYISTSTLQSGFVRMNLSVDYWGTYIHKANIHSTKILRCNRNIGNGVYDNPTMTKLDIVNGYVKQIKTPLLPRPSYMDEGSLGVFFVADVITSEDTNLRSYTSSTFLFHVGLGLFKTLILNYINTSVPAEQREIAIASLNRVNPISLALSYVSNIFQTTAERKVRVKKAYVIPSSRINISTKYYKFKTRSPYFEQAEITFDAHIVYPSVIKDAYAIDNADLDEDYLYMVGVYGNGLLISKQTSDIVIDIQYIVNEADIEVKICNGSQEKDITSAFEATITGNSEEATSLQKIGFWSKLLSNAVGLTMSGSGEMLSSYKTMGYAGVALSGVDLALKGFNLGLGNTDPLNPVGITSNGGAGATYSWNLTDEMIAQRRVSYPYVLTYFKSLADEKAKARKNGVSFEVFDLSLTDIASNYSLLGTDASETRTFITMSSEVDGVPTEARNTIRNKLLAGIYYVVVQ